jgi:hypothetical protein
MQRLIGDRVKLTFSIGRIEKTYGRAPTSSLGARPARGVARRSRRMARQSPANLWR